MSKYFHQHSPSPAALGTGEILIHQTESPRPRTTQVVKTKCERVLMTQYGLYAH